MKLLVVVHETTTVTRMKHPTERFCEVIGWIDDSRNMEKDDVAINFPILNGKELNEDVARAVSGDASIDHVDCRLVVAVHWSRAGWWKAKLRENGAKVLGMLGSRDSGIEFSFSGASSR